MKNKHSSRSCLTGLCLLLNLSAPSLLTYSHNLFPIGLLKLAKDVAELFLPRRIQPEGMILRSLQCVRTAV